ncbi:MAG: aldehyde dehydrogenase family protein [Saccharospirillaceae bacterium]|nr:aldehyde dehydrogenase family protein [Pseudomonadales bacterium]NRB80637.1 aldehyde dehydrogenase family protein [Saccharospirillaceae bacterium]
MPDVLNKKSMITVLDPQDGTYIGEVENYNVVETLQVIDTAVNAFETSKKLPAWLRMSVLNQVANDLFEQKEMFAQMIAQEGIKTIKEARKETIRCVDTLRISAEEARHLNGETISFDQVAGSENRFGYFKRLPLGVIVAITPFNDPLNLVAHKIGPAIAAGNSVILKPHSHTPLVARMLVELFAKTELPKGVLQLITGRGTVIGDVLVSDPRVRMVSFTGGRTVGHKILKKAGLKKVSLELGSNCPAIVLGDADINQALDATVSGAFWAGGQNCLHVQRIYIDESIYEQFSKEFCQRANGIRMGDKLKETTDMGPMINEQAAKKVELLIADALNNNATLLCGGKREGTFFQPTVLTDVSENCLIAKEEVFGPVTILYAFSDLKNAITMANNVDFGLQAGVFTRDLNLAFEVADALDCGGVMINDSSDYRIDGMPFGGVKGSGLGREGVMNTIHEMSQAKTYCFNLTQSL